MAGRHTGVAAATAVAVAAALLLAGCGGDRQLSLRVPAGPVAFDSALDLTVTGADPDRPVTVTASATDSSGARWSSEAVFTPAADGTVDVRRSPSVGGTYRGVHDAGLVWSMSAGDVPQFDAGDEMGIGFTASQDGATRAAADQRRRFRPPEVTATRLDRAADGFVGTLYGAPAMTSGRGPAVMVLGGSEGGLPSSLPRALAAHGVPTLAVAYFGVSGVPPTLTSIPLEYFATALHRLADQPGVDPHRITVIGSSRGSEAAELLGIHYPELVHAVVGLSPAATVNAALPGRDRSAWTLGGKPLPYLSADGSGDARRATIPVERIAGPMLLVCGDQDQVWRSCDFAESMARRRGGRDVDVLRESGAGHLVGFAAPDLPQGSGTITFGGTTLTVGGTVQDDALARLAVWPRLLAFVGGR